MTLKKMVKDYINKHQKNVQKELRWFKIQTTLDDTVSLATMAKRPSGKRFDHQRRIPKHVLEPAKNKLISGTVNFSVSDLDKK